MAQPIRIKPKIKLKDFKTDTADKSKREQIEAKTEAMCRELGELQRILNAVGGVSPLIVFQALDAGGKDGSVRKLLRHVNPAGVRVSNFKQPSEEERAHDYLWRIHCRLPRHGNIGIFNRSHYEDVLVVRVNNLVPKKVWEQRYEQINNFEKMLSENGYLILKFFLHLGKDEQAERLQERLDDPTKNWKFSEADLAVRKKWDDYQEAYEDVLNKCSTRWAPWHLIPADRKWYRDYLITKTVLSAFKKLKLKWPLPLEDTSQFKIV